MYISYSEHRVLSVCFNAINKHPQYEFQTKYILHFQHLRHFRKTETVKTGNKAKQMYS